MAKLKINRSRPILISKLKEHFSNVALMRTDYSVDLEAFGVSPLMKQGKSDGSVYNVTPFVEEQNNSFKTINDFDKIAFRATTGSYSNNNITLFYLSKNVSVDKLVFFGNAIFSGYIKLDNPTQSIKDTALFFNSIEITVR